MMDLVQMYILGFKKYFKSSFLGVSDQNLHIFA